MPYHRQERGVSVNKNNKTNQEEEIFQTTMEQVAHRIRIRPGEKLVEQVLSESEDTSKTQDNDIIYQVNETPIEITETDYGRKSDRENLNCTVDIGADGMVAYLMLYGKAEGTYTVEEIVEYLNSLKIIHGIRKKTIQRMIDERQYYEEVVIARGTDAAKGKNGYFEFHFNPTPETKPIILPDGSVDYNKLGKIELAETGQLLATYHKAIPAVDGVNIFGNCSPIDPAVDLEPLKTKGVVMTPDCRDYYATSEGKISYSKADHTLTVTPIYIIEESVDNATGDIRFNGDVLVKGNVFANTTIRATGNITVNGHVEIANLHAGKNVILKNGMQGSGIGTIQAKGEVMAKFLEQTQVYAGGKITANAILNCNIESGTEIEVSGNRGTIIGGSTKAIEKISCFALGNRVGVKTKIIVGFEKEFKEVIAELDSQIEETRDKLFEAERNLSRFSAQLSAKPDPAIAEAKAAAFRDKITYQANLKELNSKHEEMIDIRERSIDGTVVAFGPVNVGTTVIINGIKETLESERKNVNFTAKGREMRVYSNTM